MKCLPASKLPQANGVALHDWHAEILAIRSFNRFILDECSRLARDESSESDFLRRRTQEELTPVSNKPWCRQPFAWREELTLHMYCSEAPCGDASMELIMSSQDDATPWETPPSTISPSSAPSVALSPTTVPNNNPTINTTAAAAASSDNRAPQQQYQQQQLLGRGFFSQLGIVRRKPARADAPPSLSKSCSDKIALRQCASLLSSLASLFVSPTGCYLDTLVLPASQYSAAACRRCFSAEEPDGRMAGLFDEDEEKEIEGGGRRIKKDWRGTGYGFYPLQVEVTEREFEFSRRGIRGANADYGRDEEIKVVASNLAVARTAGGAVEEGLIGGVLQGRKGFDVKGASLTSRRKMWAAAVAVAGALGDKDISEALAMGSYEKIKGGTLLEGRRRVKEDVRGKALKGWLRNTGDEDFGL
ncbi:adenosine deaminase/editase [Corynascus novoguineensis]|uniref:Adenosine deaminase/editase n=1 Tax=Corynascus novoguineensis TaxID=1126955 RepID=A0AAN7D1F4_9PEZI|nr:adenosine deaminase/editase [Corynascus novoguineensis]